MGSWIAARCGLQDRLDLWLRFEKFVSVDRRGCWLWVGTNRKGYGYFYDRGHHATRAHRFLWEQINGPVPNGLELDHLCRNTKCVNPNHLEAVTHLENMRRGWNATKSYCKNGHLRTDESSYLHEYKPGYFRRGCRECHRVQSLAHRERTGYQRTKR